MESGDKGKYLVVVVANIGALSYLCTHCQSLFSDAKRERGCPREHVARANSLDNSTKRSAGSRIWPQKLHRCDRTGRCGLDPFIPRPESRHFSGGQSWAGHTTNSDAPGSYALRF
jgi:hypothetical protein